MIVYISGPMTGIQDYNHPAFNEAEKKLAKCGYTVLNPATLPIGLKDEDYMPICLSMLDAADVVALLPGHETSRGSTIEKLYAELMRKPIVTVEWMVEGEEE